MEAFAWIGQIFEALGKFIPRVLLVRATHGGVRWRFGKYVSPLVPGIYMYWPLFTQVETMVTARQTVNLPTQVLMTKDRQQVVVGTAVVYRIKDIVLAIGKRNWDAETTLSDIAQAAIVEVITNATVEEMMTEFERIEKRLTAVCRRRLRQFGVSVSRCAITDFSTCKVYKLIGNETVPFSALR